MRKKIIKTFAFVMITITSVRAQYEMGNIVVNMRNTATLNFRNTIDYVIFGENPQDQEGNYIYYQIFQKENTCTFKAVDENAPETSIVVRLESGEIFYGKVKIGDETKILYDFSKIGENHQKIEQAKTTEKEVNEKNDEKISKKELIERLHEIMKTKDKYFTLGTLDNGIMYQVANIKNDKEYTYIKLKIKNKTGNNLEIDGIFMKYFLGKVKGVKGSYAGNEERVTIEEIQGNKLVKAYSEEVIGIATRLFAVGEKGKLIIRIEEKNGNRVGTIEISGKEIQQIEVY